MHEALNIKKKLERASLLADQLSPVASDLLFEVNSAAYEGVKHTPKMLLKLVKERKVVEESAPLMELFELTGVLPSSKEGNRQL